MIFLAGHPNVAVYSPTGWRGAPGFSVEADALQAFREEARRHSSETVSFGWRERLKEEVLEIARESDQAGWDGYGAEPISSEAEFSALRLIELLPEGTMPPDIVPLPTGEIGLEWRVNAQVFSLSVTGGVLIYAGILGGGRKVHGEQPIFDELPESVTQILAQVYRAV